MQNMVQTVHTFETALHSKLEVPKRKKNQRNGECACLLGTDIGAYDTCGHLCKYCYANANSTLVKENMRKHNPASPFLSKKSHCISIGNMIIIDVKKTK